MQTEVVGGVLVITMPPRLDAAGISKIQEEFEGAVRSHRGRSLVDMSEVSFVASLALRMLLTSLKEVQPLGGDLRLCGLQPSVSEVFRKSRFDTLFKISTDRDAALADY